MPGTSSKNVQYRLRWAAILRREGEKRSRENAAWETATPLEVGQNHLTNRIHRGDGGQSPSGLLTNLSGAMYTLQGQCTTCVLLHHLNYNHSEYLRDPPKVEHTKCTKKKHKAGASEGRNHDFHCNSLNAIDLLCTGCMRLWTAVTYTCKYQYNRYNASEGGNGGAAFWGLSKRGGGACIQKDGVGTSTSAERAVAGAWMRLEAPHPLQDSSLGRLCSAGPQADEQRGGASGHCSAHHNTYDTSI